MKLTNDDKHFLLDCGYETEDFPQIECASRKTVYEEYNGENKPKKVSIKRAIEILGRKEFLSGLSRSAFHWTALRENDDNVCISFDSSKLFQD